MSSRRLGQKLNQKLSRLKYISIKARDRTKDSFFNFTHAHLIRNMITASELDFVKREPCDKDLILIAFHPTGGFGDYIISSKLLDELLLSVPCRIDVYCENVVFGQSVYGARPGVSVLPYDSMYEKRIMYDVILRAEHFIHVLNWNAHHVAKVCPEFADLIRALERSMENIRPQITQQWFREAVHFHRCQILGINRWTEMRHGSIFKITDQYTYVNLKPAYLGRVQELQLKDCRYITINRGADSMGRNTVQTKVWPLGHYEELILLFKKNYPDLQVVQLGTKNNTKISGADHYVLDESMEVTKWVLRGSMLHIDCEGGLVHLAVQLAVTCIVLFGPTPAHMYAYPTNINLISRKCSNCMGTHPDWAFSCFRGFKEPACMRSLTAEAVMKQIEKYMNENSGIEKEIIRIELKQQRQTDFSKIYQSFKSRNRQLTMNQKYQKLYDAVIGLTAEHRQPMKAAVVHSGRDFIGWYLAEIGYEVTEFDKSYGFSGKKGDTSFNRFTKCCMEHGMEMRLGDTNQLPYAAESFDLVIQFSDGVKEQDVPREVMRILKKQGILIME